MQHPAWKKENFLAARAAEAAVKLFPDDLEGASEYVHEEWKKRNPKNPRNAYQHVPYAELSEYDKSSDRNQVRLMKEFKTKMRKRSTVHGPAATVRFSIIYGKHD